jgi:hypothetical protein
MGREVMLEYIRAWFAMPRYIRQLEADVQELHDDVQRLDLDKCDDFDLKCELEDVELRLTALEDA